MPASLFGAGFVFLTGVFAVAIYYIKEFAS
jgi:hypothetical protein